jgi:uncharacterized protein YaaW (UPF0174 family)
MKKTQFALQDKDLYPILQKAQAKELAMLAEVLSEKLTSDVKKNERDPLKLAIELQSMGGDSIVNLFRRKGVCYREIADDVASKLSIKGHKDMDLLTLEEKVAEKLIEEYKKKLSETERAEFDRHLKEAIDGQGTVTNAKRVAGEVMGGAAPMLAIVGGFIFRRGAVMAVPGIGQVVGGALAVGTLLASFSGTAYSVTVPSVLIVGSIRSRIEAEKMMDEFVI